MSISFNNVPSNIRVPLFYAELDASQAGRSGDLPKTLCVGQKLAAGTATADTPILVTSDASARTLFGEGSQLAAMCISVRANDPYCELWAIPVADNGAGTQAAGLLTVTGPATASGTIYLYIAGKLIEVGVAASDAATAIAGAITAAITAADDCPVTAVNPVAPNNHKIELTARHKGTLGNDIDVRLNYLGQISGQELPTGVAIAITPMATGATDPSLTNAIAAMGDTEYDYVILGWNDATTTAAFTAEMQDVSGRWSPLRQVYGHVFCAKDDTVGNLSTAGNLLNDQHLTLFGCESVPNPPWEWGSAAAAQVAKSLKIDPARPVHTLPLVGILPPAETDRHTATERNTLLYDGVATLYTSGGYLRLDRCVTTYQTNAGGVSDTSYLDVETLATLQYILRDTASRITTKYGRHKLADDGTRFGPGQAIVTPNVIRAELVSAYRDYEYEGLVERVDDFVANLIVERNSTDPCRLDVLYPPDLVNQLRVFAMLAQFRLQYTAQAV